MGMSTGFELPYLVWSQPTDDVKGHIGPLTFEGLEQEWEANAEAHRRRGLFRLLRGIPEQSPLSVA
jgi:hypothetical protein